MYTSTPKLRDVFPLRSLPVNFLQHRILLLVVLLILGSNADYRMSVRQKCAWIISDSIVRVPQGAHRLAVSVGLNFQNFASSSYLPLSYH
jgi:hypothetical protein